MTATEKPGGDNIKVAVRLRPLNKREKQLGGGSVISIKGNTAAIQSPPDYHKKIHKSFTFDFCFDSSTSPDSPDFSGQSDVFEAVGRDLVESALEGYNGCLFAYGQTGSGKSYTMMGTDAALGLIPRLSACLFERIQEIANEDDGTSFSVEVSYIEIYNEKVHDLLDPQGASSSLRVREHAVLGPYVDGLTQLVVGSYAVSGRMR
ncbi:unnamed protein product, partial [Cyprideis torosa]